MTRRNFEDRVPAPPATLADESTALLARADEAIEGGLDAADTTDVPLHSRPVRRRGER